jgi:transformer-2 protein
VDLIKDKRSNHSKGFAFIYFASLNEAIEAKEKAHDLELDGNIIRTDYSRTPRGHSPTPGQYMGHKSNHRRH